jgi:hypothetical protein
VIQSGRPSRFDPNPTSKTSLRQNSTQHFFHKQETPFHTSQSPSGAVKVEAFQPRPRFGGFSHSPDILPVHVQLDNKKEEIKQAI